MALFWSGRKRGWILGLYNDEVHILPVKDLIQHTAEDCVCGTLTEPCPRDDGSMGWFVTHYSLDGRDKE